MGKVIPSTLLVRLNGIRTWQMTHLSKWEAHSALLELKEANLLLCVWLPTDANMVDMYITGRGGTSKELGTLG